MTIPATTRVALTDFVLERIAEDEEEARVLVGIYEGYLATLHTDPRTWGELAPHFDRWNPHRVLAECAVKRRIVGMFQVAQVIQSCKSYPGEESAVRLMVDALEGVVRVHATVYADHPDYQTNWRPTP